MKQEMPTNEGGFAVKGLSTRQEAIDHEVRTEGGRAEAKDVKEKDLDAREAKNPADSRDRPTELSKKSSGESERKGGVKKSKSQPKIRCES